jgi:hypothetical protein
LIIIELKTARLFAFTPSPTSHPHPMEHTAAKLLEERVMLERVRCSVMKEQADLRVERANWERDKAKSERDELHARVLKLQSLLDREKKRRPRWEGKFIGVEEEKE